MYLLPEYPGPVWGEFRRRASDVLPRDSSDVDSELQGHENTFSDDDGGQEEYSGGERASADFQGKG